MTAKRGLIVSILMFLIGFVFIFIGIALGLQIFMFQHLDQSELLNY